MRVGRRRRDGARTRLEIREAAAALFYKNGYEATSLRAVAAEVGIKVGSLYNHMGGKDELLLDIMTAVMNELTPLVENAATDAGTDPIERLEAAIGAHIRYHAQHARETFIGNSELRSLKPDQRKLISKRRLDYEQLIRSFIEEAAHSSGVPLLDARLQPYAVLALGMHVASWFRDTSDVSLDQVVNVYTDVTLRQLGLSEISASTEVMHKAPS